MVVEEAPEGLTRALGEVGGLYEGPNAAQEADLDVFAGRALLHVLAEALEVAALEVKTQVAREDLGVD